VRLAPPTGYFLPGAVCRVPSTICPQTSTLNLLNPGTLYETTIKANRRTAEYRISNVEGWIRFAQSFFYKIDRIHYFDIRYSLFDIRYSLFQSFFFDLTGRSRPAAALNPEPLNLSIKNRIS
jgi:hypothetical protein